MELYAGERNTGREGKRTIVVGITLLSRGSPVVQEKRVNIGDLNERKGR